LANVSSLQETRIKASRFDTTKWTATVAVKQGGTTGIPSFYIRIEYPFFMIKITID